MKLLSTLLLVLVIQNSCNQSNNDNAEEQPTEQVEKVESEETDNSIKTTAAEKASPSELVNKKLILIGFITAESYKPIRYLENKISISLKEDGFPGEKNAFWCEIRTGDICFDHPYCYFYQINGGNVSFFNARINRKPIENNANYRSYCEIAPTVECDYNAQPKQEKSLIREHIIELLQDEKSIEKTNDTVKLISTSGSKKTLVYKIADQ